MGSGITEMDLLIVSGLSGAGKSTAAQYLEDMGFYCIDNLPPQLLKAMLTALSDKPRSLEPSEERFALVMDARSVKRFGDLTPALKSLKEGSPGLRIVYLEASEEIILSRYKQSRRNHPLAGHVSLSTAIRKERRDLATVRAMATDIIDTTGMSRTELRDRLYELFHSPGSQRRLTVMLQSFGFKYGVPSDSDLLLDVRFIPNPYYQLELRPLSGLDQEVNDFIFSYPESGEYLQKQADLLSFLLPFYEREGKVRLNIAVGCTGGRHRSVLFAEKLRERIAAEGYRVFVDHRDIQREAVGDS